MSNLVLSLAFFGAIIAVASSVCSVPPMFWCLHNSIAKKCGVETVCKKYNQTVADKAIKLTLFYESLCGGCQHMILDIFPELVSAFKENELQIDLVPFGNAKIENGTIVCQHGPDECVYNKFESCAIHYIKPSFPFINCFEQQLHQGVAYNQSKEHCYQTQHTSASVQEKMETCASGQMGDMLQQLAAKQTQQAKPDDHKWVPWVLFQDASFKKAQLLVNDAATATASLCLMYEGSNTPEPCQLMANEETELECLINPEACNHPAFDRCYKQ